MAFGLVHSSAERSTSRHGHHQASAGLLNQLAFVLVLGFSQCMEMAELSTTRNVVHVLVLEILRVAYPIFGILKETAEVQRVCAALNHKEEQIC